MVRSLTAALAMVVALGAAPALAWSHPLHTTLAEVVIDDQGSLRVTLRAFADDFSAAVARHAGKPKPSDFGATDADVTSYIAATVVVQDLNGRRIPLEWSGARRTGELMWITVRAPGIRSLKGIRVAYSTLFETFPDQVNILQSNDNGRRHTVLFTASDGRSSKPIL